MAAESIGKAYKPFLIASLVVLVGSLGVLAIAMTLAFLDYTGRPMPLGLTVFAVLGALGLGLGFAGFFLIMLAAAWQTWREGRRVQVIPPQNTGSPHSPQETRTR